MEPLTTDFEYKFSTAFAKKNIAECMLPIMGTKYAKASPWKRIMFLDWGCECKKDYVVDFGKYYNGEIKNIELKSNIVQNDVSKKAEKLFSKMEKDFSMDNILYCHFLVRPMKSGFDECVKCLWNENKEDQRKLLFEKGLEEVDIVNSIELLDYIVQIAKPNVICVTGIALKNLIDYCLKEKLSSDIEHLKNNYNNAAVIPLPYSYREIAFTKNDVWGLADDRHKKFAIKNLSEKYQDYCFDCDIDNGAILSCLKDEIKIAGKTEYIAYRNMMDGFINALNIHLVKDCFSNLCNCVDLMIEANVKKVASENKRNSLEGNRLKKKMPE